MKKRKTLKIFNTMKAQHFNFILFTISLFSSFFLQAKTVHEKKSTITEVVDVNELTQIITNHDFGDIRVKKIEGNQAKFEANVVVRGEDLEALEKVIKKYQLKVSKYGNEANVESTFGIKSWYSNSGGWFSKAKHYIKFNDGTRVDAKISDLNAELIIYLPTIAKLKLTQKHHNIFAEDLNSSLEMDLFDGDFEIGNVSGDLIIDLKHGNGKGAHINKGDLKLFDSHVKFLNGKDLLINSKHSTLKMQHLKSVDMDIFDSRVELLNVDSTFNAIKKHSTVKAGHIGSGKWKLFDSSFEILDADHLQIDGKHGTYTLQNVDQLDIESFDVRVEANRVENINLKNTKHSRLQVKRLGSGLESSGLFDTNLDLLDISKEVEIINFEGEHSRLNVDFPNDLMYKMDVNLEHSDFDLDLNNYDFDKYIEKDIRLVILGKLKGANESSPTLRVYGKMMNIDIK